MGFYVYTEKTSHIFYFTFASWWILSVYISVFFSIDIAHLFMFMLSSHIYYSVLSYLVSFEEARLVREGNKKKIIFTVIGYIPPHKIHHFVTKKTSTPPKPPTSRFFSPFFLIPSLIWPTLPLQVKCSFVWNELRTASPTNHLVQIARSLELPAPVLQACVISPSGTVTV